MTLPFPTRLRLIESARELFRARGYEATSVADILKKARVNSGSFYYFFRSKEDLLLAVLDRYTELLWPLVMEPIFTRVSDPVERIFALLDGYRQGLIATEFTKGCPIGNLALEMSDHNPKAREKIAANFEVWCGWIRKCLDDAGDRLPPDLDGDKLSTFVLTVMEGGVMQARALRSLAPYDASVDQLRDYFNRLLSARASMKVNSPSSSNHQLSEGGIE